LTLTRIPIFLVILNILSSKTALRKLEQTFQKLASKFSGRIIFGWCDGLYNPAKKMLIGHKYNGVFPVGGFFTVDQSKNLIYPERLGLDNFGLLERFFTDFLDMDFAAILGKYNESNLEFLEAKEIFGNGQNSTGVWFVDGDWLVWAKKNQVLLDGTDFLVLQIPSSVDGDKRGFGFRKFLAGVNLAKGRFDHFNRGRKMVWLLTFDGDAEYLKGGTMGLGFVAQEDLNDGHKEIVLGGKRERNSLGILEFIRGRAGGRYFLPEYAHMNDEGLEEYFIGVFNKKKFG
jgi:hypothetical protein